MTRDGSVSAKKVSDFPEEMTDPRNIQFMEKQEHIDYHKKNGY